VSAGALCAPAFASMRHAFTAIAVASPPMHSDAISV
jgi:hypothetical protein